MPDAMAIARVLDVLAPFYPGTKERVPIFEWAHEVMPTDEEMVQLARRLVHAVRGEDGAPASAMRASITCPVCHRTSHHPSDVSEGYCGACHAFTGRPCALESDQFIAGTKKCPSCGWPPERHPHE